MEDKDGPVHQLSMCGDPGIHVLFPAFPGVPDTQPDTMSCNLQLQLYHLNREFPKSNHQQHMNNTVQLSSIFGCLELKIPKQLLL